MEYEGEEFQLTEYQIKKTVKAFKYLDKKKKGLLKFDLLGSLLRCSGYNLSLKEVQKIKEKIIENKTVYRKKDQLDEKDQQDQNPKRQDNENVNREQEENSSLNNIDNNEKEKYEIKEQNNNNNEDDNNNISKLLSNLKNYDNFMEIEKQKEQLRKQEEENKNIFTIKEYFRIIQIPDIINETKPVNVLNAFEIFDEKGNGTISIKRLRFILQYLGEPLTNVEFDEFFEWIKTLDKVYKTDYIIYEDLINELINKDSNI
ncbi:calmodulin, putative [Plasmodium sp. gorilla clade G2]|uniref:calmodulin, putative n=1 Tax=Plasmodium sp. gorilla clade G2 TaxID=880535 RepID=UPI000D211E99|nr:calmodulin, putative [Plasmodium sp. gorilla clade G2]SOV13024.1 calmodulin, putative [Plasmodium sp. gorilla clade G2]